MCLHLFMAIIAFSKTSFLDQFLNHGASVWRKESLYRRTKIRPSLSLSNLKVNVNFKHYYKSCFSQHQLRSNRHYKCEVIAVLSKQSLQLLEIAFQTMNPKLSLDQSCFHSRGTFITNANSRCTFTESVWIFARRWNLKMA